MLLISCQSGSPPWLEGRKNLLLFKDSLLLRKSDYSVNHRFKHISSLFGILLSVLFLEPAKFERVDDGVTLCEFEIELLGISRATLFG